MTHDLTDLIARNGRQKRTATVGGNLVRFLIIDVVELLEISRPINTTVADKNSLAIDQRPRHVVVPSLPVYEHVSTADVQLAANQLRLQLRVVQLDGVQLAEKRYNLQLVGGQRSGRALLAKLLYSGNKTLVN